MAEPRRKTSATGSTTKTSAGKPTTPSRGSVAPAPTHDAAFDELVSGRVALQTIEAQLDQQADTLRAQLAVNRWHREQTDELLEKIDAKLATRYPSLFKLLHDE
jgi:hypothetical protein